MTDRDYNNPAALSALARGDFANAIAAASPGGIERQEAAGQQALVSNFRQLPKDMGENGLEIAAALGFKIGKEADELFLCVEAPPGWSMSATGHSMHNEILDAEGNKRGAVFYKAAFYDRRADGYWLPRYRTERHYPTEGDYETTVIRAVDYKTGIVLWAGEPLTRPEGPYGAQHRLNAEREAADFEAATSVLTERFPEWKSPVAYWSDA